MTLLYFSRLKSTLSVGHIVLVAALIELSSAATFANVVGPDAQNFNSITSGVDFVTVHSSETLDPGIFNFGVFLNYAINTLPLFEDPELQSRQRYNDSLLMADFNIGVGLMENWEVGFSYPRLLAQDVDADEDVPRGQFGGVGNTELRFMTKVRFFGEETHGLAFVLSSNVNRIQNNPYTGRDPGPTVNFELVGDVRVAQMVALGLNFGYRKKDPGERIEGSTIEPTGDQMIYSAAANFLVKPIRSKIITEVFGSLPAEDEDNEVKARQASSAEILLGIKSDITTQLAFHVGAGTELISGVSSPDWRVYSGLNYALGPVWGGKEKGTVKLPETGKAQKTSDPLKVPIKKGETVITLDAIRFEFDSATRLRPGAARTIRRLVKYLNKPPEFKRLTIVGHTDYVGSDEYNVNLSIRRAWTIRNILIKHFKIDPDKIYTLGYGKQQPVADNGNYQGRQRNRRVEFVIKR